MGVGVSVGVAVAGRVAVGVGVEAITGGMGWSGPAVRPPSGAGAVDREQAARSATLLSTPRRSASRRECSRIRCSAIASTLRSSDIPASWERFGRSAGLQEPPLPGRGRRRHPHNAVGGCGVEAGSESHPPRRVEHEGRREQLDVRRRRGRSESPSSRRGLTGPWSKLLVLTTRCTPSSAPSRTRAATSCCWRSSPPPRASGCGRCPLVQLGRFVVVVEALRGRARARLPHRGVAAVEAHERELRGRRRDRRDGAVEPLRLVDADERQLEVAQQRKRRLAVLGVEPAVVAELDGAAVVAEPLAHLLDNRQHRGCGVSRRGRFGRSSAGTASTITPSLPASCSGSSASR